MNWIKRHYSWLICGIGLLIHFCNCGIVVTAFSMFLPLIRSGLNLTNTNVSMMLTIRSLVAMVVTMFSVRYYKHFSLRKGISLVSLLVPLGMMILSMADNVWLCYVAVAIMGVAYGIGAMVPISYLMKNWFKTGFSVAMSICTLGSGVATVCIPPVITKIVSEFGLQTAFKAVALFSLICAILVFLIVREKPSDIGLEAYDNKNEERKEDKKKEKILMSTDKWLLIFISCFFVGVIGTTATSNISIHLVTAGYTAAQAAAATSVFGAVLIIGKLLNGISNEKFGAKKMNFVFISLFALACAAFLFSDGQSTIFLYLPAVLYGLGGSIGALAISSWTSDFSKDNEFRTKMQKNQTLFAIGSLIATPFPGIMADLTGSYNATYFCDMVISILMLLLIQIVYFTARKA